VRQLAVNLSLLDRMLANYGPEAADVRTGLREAGFESFTNAMSTCSARAR